VLYGRHVLVLPGSFVAKGKWTVEAGSDGSILSAGKEPKEQDFQGNSRKVRLPVPRLAVPRRALAEL